MLGEKIKETNVSSSNKCKVSNTIHLIKILILSAHAPLCEMERKKVKNLSTNKEVYQFQVACVSYIYLKKTRHSRRKLISVCLLNFMVKTSARMMKNLNTTVTMSFL